MKRILSMLMFALILAFGNIASATPVEISKTYTVDFQDFTFWQPFTFNVLLNIEEQDADYDVNIPLDPGQILSAEISLTHLNNIVDPVEFCWYLKSGDEFIGNLSESNMAWVTDTWTLNQNIINKMMTDGELPISFWNDSDEMGLVLVDILSVTTNEQTNASPVPEPASMFLL
ncbi:MAG: hypothetical protein Q7T50_01430, partial [Candidatus Magasanikbacteria bacterium]|nr:hypothetical protein [Candidatus Magasanikbacteria bacterium]